MDGTTTTAETARPDELDPAEGTIPITLRLVAVAGLGGLLGLVAMVPVMVALPSLLGVFRTEPILNFAQIGKLVGLEPSLALGLTLFLVGGVGVVPLLFVATGGFLPPREPRYLRGVPFVAAMWTGFALAFWPSGSATTVSLFLVFSLAGHVVYGLSLGIVLHRFADIPEHDV